MANKSNENQPGEKAGSVSDRSSRRNEFDDAVTTDIPDDLTKAFDEHHTGDPGDPFITDVSLTKYVDIENDEVLPPGFLLRDRFEIVELVYAAGMSHIYKAIDQQRRPKGSGDVHVAIKIMRPSIVSDDLARLSLQREAAIAQRLSHPNIINIFDFDDHDGQSFLVMEWLEGESVNAMLRRTSGEGVEAGLARAVITGFATGVQHAHRNDVVHADINPSNIFITDTGEIKLLDFGVARTASAAGESEEDRFAFVTQTYASPEVLSGLPAVVEDDVFSLACVVYRLLSGRHPFGGALSLVAKDKRVSVEPIPGLADGEWDTLRRALSYERADRPGSVGEFVTWGADVAEGDESEERPAQRFMPPDRMWLAILATAVILAGGAWLYSRGTVDEVTLPVEPAVPEETAAAEPAITASEALVIAANQAFRDGQLIAPAEVNARALFRAALVLESGNPEALLGLRAISDDFVQAAQEALNRDDLTAAYAALTVATETDPENPTIGIVEQLLSAKGDGELAEARLAVTTGDFDIAEQKLSIAEQYQHIDPAEVRRLRQQIEERLTERAAATTADTDVAPASELPDANDAPEVLTPEVEAAQLSPNAVGSEAETLDAPDPQVADEQPGTAIEPAEVQPPPITEEQSDNALLQSSTNELDVSEVPEEAVPEVATTPAVPEMRRLSLQELGIREYSAPTFPRRALRRNLSGMVEVKFVVNAAGTTESIEVLHSEPGDVFSQSAINAIEKWRFETREEPINAQITLRFDQ